MAIYHGSKFIAVLKTFPDECWVEQVDFKPTGELGSFVQEPTFLNIPDELATYPRFDTPEAAKIAVRTHQFDTSESEFLALSYAVASSSFDLQRLRALKPKGSEKIKSVTYKEEGLASHRKQLKALNSWRTRRITIK